MDQISFRFLNPIKASMFRSASKPAVNPFNAIAVMARAGM
jgi:hypothetical protein